ncbi:hypothetical protein KPP03845_200052 (plasmid) [Streptomyces xanthophaeus]|nr:hypothetical protein KPP03845_200052 [Streptomyces xanthophaeus]
MPVPTNPGRRLLAGVGARVLSESGPGALPGQLMDLMAPQPPLPTCVLGPSIGPWIEVPPL